MRIANIYPTPPTSNGALVSAISPITASSFSATLRNRDWWDVLSSQLGTRVADMLRDSLYGNNFELTGTPSPRVSQEDILRFTLENEIRQAQMQQRLFAQEEMEQNQQFKVAQLYAKSDLWLLEKERLIKEKEAQKEAQMRIVARSQEPINDETQDVAIKKAEVAGENQAENTKQEDSNTLDDKEQQQVDELASIDREVRSHENAHLAAAGGLAQGGASFSYTQGPDGKMYATAGEVSIDTSSTGEPQKDIDKARQIRSAAMAPSDPSPQDFRVASDAVMMEMQAQIKLGEELNAELRKMEGVKIYKENIELFDLERSAPPSFRAIA